MGVSEILDDLKERLEEPSVRWSAVGVVVLILLRLRLVLFAAALPILVYWAYSQRGEGDPDRQERAPLPPQRHRENQGDDDEFEDEFVDNPKADLDEGEANPYDDSFWDERQAINEAKATRREPDEAEAARQGVPPCDDLMGLGNLKLGGDDDDLGGNFDFGLNQTSLDDMSFLSGGMDLSFGDGFDRGKGKGKSKGDGKGKGKDKGKDPRQIFVGGIAHLDEDAIREFFEEYGEVEVVRVVMDKETGNPKGFGFVTFRTEEEAEQVGRLQVAEIGGRRVTVRLASAGKEEKGDRGGGKGGRGKGDFSFTNHRENRDFGEAQRSRDYGDAPRRPRDFEDPPEQVAPAGRGGAVDNEQPDREPIDELDEIIQEALSEEDKSPLMLSDFDAGAKRFLEELRKRDGNRALEALDTVLQQTRSKARESVRKWPAYVFTLLQKFDKELADELAEQNIKRKIEEREARRAEGATRGDVARALQYAPPVQESGRQVLDRWGKPVVLE